VLPLVALVQRKQSYTGRKG